MRKFTKEISALLAATAMGASVCIASSAETAENIYRTDGVATMSDEEVRSTTAPYSTTAGVLTTSYDEEYFPPEDGVAMPEDYYIQPTTLAPTEVPPPIGTYVYEEPTEEEFPPTAGVPLPPDETIEPTTIPEEDFTQPIGTMMYEEPTEEIPPLVGDPMPPDEEIPTILPPTAGETIPSDETIAKPTLRGDADLNGITELADLVTVSKHVLNKSAFPLKNKVAEANADMNGDKTIDVLDVSELTEDQLGK